MGQPAAKQGDQVIATDIHIVMIPSPGGPVPTPLPNPVRGPARRRARDRREDRGQGRRDEGLDGDEHAVPHPRRRPVPDRRPRTRRPSSSAAPPC